MVSGQTPDGTAAADGNPRTKARCPREKPPSTPTADDLLSIEDRVAFADYILGHVAAHNIPLDEKVAQTLVQACVV